MKKMLLLGALAALCSTATLSACNDRPPKRLPLASQSASPQPQLGGLNVSVGPGCGAPAVFAVCSRLAYFANATIESLSQPGVRSSVFVGSDGYPRYEGTYSPRELSIDQLYGDYVGFLVPSGFTLISKVGPHGSKAQHIKAVFTGIIRNVPATVTIQLDAPLPSAKVSHASAMITTTTKEIVE